MRVVFMEVFYKSSSGNINKLISYQDVNEEYRNDKSKNYLYHHSTSI